MPSSNSNNAVPQNLLLVALLILITLFTAFHEGYLPLISVLFGASLIAAFLISAWLALSISTGRFLALIAVIIVMEYIKETIGIRSKVWTYHGINGMYNFGIWSWVWGGLIAYTLSTRAAVSLLKKLRLSLPRWINPIILCVIFLLIPLTLGKYGSGVGVLFWVFYILLLGVGVYAAGKIDFAILAALVITAWVVANPSEYLGSASSKVWTFTYNPDYPPFFLLFGCWPLEIVAQYSLSAFLVKEPLNGGSQFTVHSSRLTD